MGLFSGKKKTYVSSTVYNMAGDIKDRPHYLRTMVTGRILSNRPQSQTLTSDANRNYLAGPGIDLRRFGRWARLYGYNANLGQVHSSISVPGNLNTTTVATQLSLLYGKEVYINKAEMGIADYGMWANQYMLANHADLYLTNWAADFDEATNQITIKVPAGPTFVFSPTDFVPLAQYMYVSLNQEKESESTLVTSDWVDGIPVISSDFDLSSSSTSDTSVELIDHTAVVQTVGTGDPAESTFENPHTEVIALTQSLYVHRSKLPDPDDDLVVGLVTKSIETREVIDIRTSTSTSEIVEEVSAGTRVSEITRTAQTLHKKTQYRTSTVTVREKSWENEEIFIYRYGTGNAALDALFFATSEAGSFFPTVPIRIDNKFVTEPQYANILPWVKKAVSRSTDFSFEKLLGIVEDNPNLKDIDFAYMIFGVSLNSTENAAKRYIYEFFRNAGQPSAAAMAQFWADYNAAVASWEAWTKWYESGRYEAPKFSLVGGTPLPAEPVRLPMPTLPSQSINISSQQNYNITISFSAVGEEVHAGKFSDNAKINDLRIYKGTSLQFREYPEQENRTFGLFRFNKFKTDEYQTIIIDWQYATNSYRRMTITGLRHVNYVYRGKSVSITAWDALDDLEESGFIIPLQEETLRGLPIPVATQLSTAATYMMFNSYLIVKQKWYQTGAFKIILVIVIIIISIVFPPAGGAGGAGVLGTNAAVGASLGFTGTAAIVAGAIANAVVATIVSEIISRAAIAVFGNRIGGVIGAIASFITISVGSNMAGGQPMSAAFGNMINVENLMKLTSALSEGLAEYYKASAADTQQEIVEVLDDYQRQAKAIAEKFNAEFGDGAGAVIDPFSYTDAFQFKIENPGLFLERTLMNGTDIAQLSHDMLDNFTDLTTATTLE